MRDGKRRERQPRRTNAANGLPLPAAAGIGGAPAAPPRLREGGSGKEIPPSFWYGAAAGEGPTRRESAGGTERPQAPPGEGDAIAGSPGPEIRDGAEEEEEEGPPLPSPSAGKACLERKGRTASAMVHRGRRAGTGARPRLRLPAPGHHRDRACPRAPGPSRQDTPRQPPHPQHRAGGSLRCRPPIRPLLPSILPRRRFRVLPPPLPGCARRVSRARRRAAAVTWDSAGPPAAGGGAKPGRGHRGHAPFSRQRLATVARARRGAGAVRSDRTHGARVVVGREALRTRRGARPCARGQGARAGRHGGGGLRRRGAGAAAAAAAAGRGLLRGAGGRPGEGPGTALREAAGRGGGSQSPRGPGCGRARGLRRDPAALPPCRGGPGAGRELGARRAGLPAGSRLCRGQGGSSARGG